MMRLLRRAFRVLRYWLATFGESEQERTARLIRQAQACLDELAGLHRGVAAVAPERQRMLEAQLLSVLGVRGLAGCGFAAEAEWRAIQMQSDLDAQREAFRRGEWERMRQQAFELSRRH